MGNFKSAQPLTDTERAPEPTLKGALDRIEGEIVHRRYKSGYHQGYLSRATPETKKIGNRIQGEPDES